MLQQIVIILMSQQLYTTVIAKDKLHILGLYPFTGSWPAGDIILAASRLAVEQINQNSSLLTDYELMLEAADSAVSNSYIDVGFNVFPLFRSCCQLIQFQ